MTWPAFDLGEAINEAIGGLVTVLSVGLAAWFAVGQYRKQRQFDRRLEWFEKVTEALSVYHKAIAAARHTLRADPTPNADHLTLFRRSHATLRHQLRLGFVYAPRGVRRRLMELLESLDSGSRALERLEAVGPKGIESPTAEAKPAADAIFEHQRRMLEADGELEEEMIKHLGY